MIPASVEALHEVDAALDQPPSHQAVVREQPLPSDIRAVAFEDVLRLGREIGQLRDTGPHLVRHLVLSDAADDLQGGDLCELGLVEHSQIVEQPASHHSRLERWLSDSVLYGGTGDGWLCGGSGSDKCDGGIGADTISGS